MALEVYSSLTALGTLLSTQWAGAVSDKSATGVDTPGGYTVVEPGLTRLRHTSFPWVFIIPAPRGQPFPLEPESTMPMSRWVLPVRIWLGMRDDSGKETDAHGLACDYLQVMDYILTNNNQPDSFSELGARRRAGFGAFEGPKRMVWGAFYDVELGIRPSYS
ncbi:MAG: hypothetical protein B7733_07085 [Myxococcales bacterium FL481]|nr:MAG: hypothetical protein B7733_07085 [Myxococcales bacterium FL481]